MTSSRRPPPVRRSSALYPLPCAQAEENWFSGTRPTALMPSLPVAVAGSTSVLQAKALNLGNLGQIVFSGPSGEFGWHDEGGLQ